ncbi:heme peroxidase family protein [Saccharothrix xinjiangensis]|uniref:Heme peroxidase family protein n=1 Tax=Saccharothrix xinjiangensis TaxID=204798 RepID=A0ABV9Y1H9_9PSEU
MKQHGRNSFFVVGEGVIEFDRDGNALTRRPAAVEELRRFRFSRLGPEGAQLDEGTRVALADAMTAAGAQPESADPPVPAGFTYLGQFVDHDLTMDRTETQLGEDVTLDELVQGRSPALDLDSLYGRGPDDHADRVYYAADRVKLKVGTTSPASGPPGDQQVTLPMEGFDLPRFGQTGLTEEERRRPLIPDPRNDENLAVAQTHLAFIRFHNQVVDELALRGLTGRRLFEAARGQVVRHYQWLLRHDFLPRVVDPAIVDDVFTNGRRFFEAPRRGRPVGPHPTMPLEFAVAAYRLGHSMIRSEYEWNRVFNTGTGIPGTLFLLFAFSGTSGNFDGGSSLADLDDPHHESVDALPTNWIADFRRLYDFAEVDRPDLAPPAGGGNAAMRIDSLLVDPLDQLPAGTFGGRGAPVDDVQRNLAFRNLTRAGMVRLASGQQMAELLCVDPLTEEQVLVGNGGASLDQLTDEQRAAVAAATPLWFYALREAEFNGGRLGPVGGRVVAEVFHRAMEGSRTSIVREPSWRPVLGPDRRTFRMTDLLLFAFEGKADLLNPLGD